MTDALEIGQLQINTDGDPNLHHDAIPGDTQQALDLEILLVPLEEQPDSALCRFSDGSESALKAAEKE